MRKLDEESKQGVLTKKIESIDSKDLEDELLSKTMDNISTTFIDNESKLIDNITRTEFSIYMIDKIKQKDLKLRMSYIMLT